MACSGLIGFLSELEICMARFKFAKRSWMPSSNILSSSASSNAGICSSTSLHHSARSTFPILTWRFSTGLDREMILSGSGVKHFVHSSAGDWASPSTVNPAQ